NGANGRPPALNSRQYPHSTRTPPAARARLVNSLTSRDLPTPASPPMSTADGRPSRTRSRAASSAASSSARPTKTGTSSPRLTSYMMSLRPDGPPGQVTHEREGNGLSRMVIQRGYSPLFRSAARPDGGADRAGEQRAGQPGPAPDRAAMS